MQLSKNFDIFIQNFSQIFAFIKNDMTFLMCLFHKFIKIFNFESS